VRNSSILLSQQGHESKLANEFFNAYLASALDSVDELTNSYGTSWLSMAKAVAEKGDPQYSCIIINVSHLEFMFTSLEQAF
jgi:hypothetical protein